MPQQSRLRALLFHGDLDTTNYTYRHSEFVDLPDLNYYINAPSHDANTTVFSVIVNDFVLHIPDNHWRPSATR